MDEEAAGRPATREEGRKAGAEVAETWTRRSVWLTAGEVLVGAGREARDVRSSAGARASAPEVERNEMCEGRVRGAASAASGSEICLR